MDTISAKDIAQKFNLEMVGQCTPIKNLGLINYRKEQLLSFAENKEHIEEGLSNPSICALITKEDFVKDINTDKALLLTNHPRYVFCKIQNYLVQETNFYTEKRKNIIKSAQIHKTAYVADHNVYIGNNVSIEPNVTILENTHIEDNVRIQSGTVVGVEGNQVARHNDSLFFLRHGGAVHIDKGVEIGANCVVDKGVFRDTTFIGENCMIGSFCYVSHNDYIGKRVVLASKVGIGGSVTIENDVWVGSGVITTNGIKIGENAFISIGAVVTKDVQKNTRVSGNFAINHEKFIKFIKLIR